MFRKFIFMLLIVSLLISSMVFAEQNPADYHYNGGYYVSSYDTIRGAKANITYTAKPRVYNESMSSIWVMIADNNTQSLAQTGYALDLITGSSTVYYFMGVLDTNGQYSEYTTGNGPATGTNHEYKIYATGNQGTAKGAINGVDYWTKTIDFYINSAMYEAEIYNTDAQFMGTTSKPETFSNVSMQNNTTWSSPSLSWDPAGGIVGLDKSTYSTSKSFKVWDTRY